MTNWATIAPANGTRRSFEASEMLKENASAGDAVESLIVVEEYPYYKSVGYGGLPNEEGWSKWTPPLWM